MSTVTCGSVELTGTIMAKQDEGPQIHVERTDYAGLLGTTEVRLGYGGGMIEVPMLLHSTSFTSAAKVEAKLLELKRFRGINATLEIGGLNPSTHNDCTFHGFFKTGPILEDIARTLESGSECFFVPGVARFFQLSIEKD